jgi:uncharacterized Zn finger protein (UPF0148 family)
MNSQQKCKRCTTILIESMYCNGLIYCPMCSTVYDKTENGDVKERK